jgi:uncharacterized protein (TIGR02466 family)
MSNTFPTAAVESFFPTPVWVLDLEPARAARLNAQAVEDLEAMTSPRPPLAPDQNWQTQPNLHSFEELAELVGIFEEAIGEALRMLEVAHDGFEITGCWANLSPPGRSHRVHSHANNYLSGVYYVQTAPGADTISFHDPRLQVEQIAPRVRRRNAFNSNACHLTVTAGRLVLFPSWLSHSVPENTSEVLRISISFNAMFSSFTRSASPPGWTGIELRGRSQRQ